MLNKAINIITKTHNSIFLLVGLAMLVLGVASYFLFGRQASDSLIEQILHREQVVARAGTVSLKAFESGLNRQVAAYSTRPYIRSFDLQNAQRDLETLLNSWKGSPVSVAILVDTKGVVQFGLDREGSKIVGVDVSDREYFEWAKTAEEGDTYVGTPVQGKAGFAAGRYVVPVASPVIKNGSFNGVLVVSFLLDEVRDRYLTPLKITDGTRIYYIDQDGVILSGDVEKLVGVNYLDYLNKSGKAGSAKTVDILKGVLMFTDEGKIDIALPNENNNGELTRYLIAYSPFAIGDRHWLIVVATPIDDALEYLTPFYFRELGFVGLVLLAFMIISIRISKILGYMEGIELEHRIHKKLPSEE